MDLSRDHGFRCLVAGDGETGLQFADYYKPSAIILDIGLPGINGWAVMARLKDNPETRHIPVHFLSAFDQKPDAMKMGAVDHLKKPVTPEALVQAFDNINRMISKPGSLKAQILRRSSLMRRPCFFTALKPIFPQYNKKCSGGSTTGKRSLPIKMCWSWMMTCAMCFH